MNSKVTTAPKLKVEDKDRVNNSRRIKAVKLNIVKLKASLNKFSRGKLVIEVECQTLCNDPTIGSYNDYHLSSNGIPSGNQR